MHLIMTSHVRRYHAHYESSGHIWQGRFKSFIVQEGNHLLTVLRYVEGNPVRANLVKSAKDWMWSSHRESIGEQPRFLVDEIPIELPQDWGRYVDEPLTEKEIDNLDYETIDIFKIAEEKRAISIWMLLALGIDRGNK